jgi:uncharacterized protein YdaU (DUF1376 family)
MHYFKLHINDYAQATAHLSLLEDAAYTRLLRKYYADERPLPADLDRLQRLIGARSRDEKIAVRTVLEEFFSLDGDFYRNKRADEEIAEYQSKSLKAKESANARWMRTHSEGNGYAMPPLSDGNANHKPLTTNHEPLTNKEKTKRVSAPASEPNKSKGTRIPFTELPDDWSAFCRAERPDLEPIKVWASFYDYWIATSGAKGVKADWFATWRNWVRKERQTTTAKQNDSWRAKLASLNTIDMEPSNGQVLSTDIVSF